MEVVRGVSAVVLAYGAAEQAVGRSLCEKSVCAIQWDVFVSTNNIGV
jgi:hypothetical protein